MALVYDHLPAVLYALDLISQGHMLTEACDMARIRVATFETYVANDPDLQDMKIEADRRCNDALVDALLSPDKHKIYGRTEAQMAKVISDNIKWRLSKLDAKRFGERVEIHHNITMDRAITQALEASRGRVRHLEHHPTIDVTPAPPPPAEDDDAIMAAILA